MTKKFNKAIIIFLIVNMLSIFVICQRKAYAFFEELWIAGEGIHLLLEYFFPTDISGTTGVAILPSHRLYTGDFNGDGKTDFAFTYSSNGYWSSEVHTSTGSDFSKSTWANQQGEYNVSQQWVGADFNGDGKQDFAKFWNDGGFWTADVHLSTGSSFAMQRWATQQGGYVDQLNCPPPPPPATSEPQLSCLVGDGPCSMDSTNTCPIQHWFVGDFNGDGKSDFMKFWNDGGYWTADVHVSTGSGFTMQRWATKLGGFSGDWYKGDFDGDKKTDFAKIWNDGGSWSIDIYRSTGNGFTVSRWATNQGTVHTGQVWVVGDFNGDGKADFATYWTDNGYWTADIYLSIGSSFSGTRWATQQGLNNGVWLTGDFNGDGRTDFLEYWNDNGNWSADVHISTGNTFTMSRWATQQGLFSSSVPGDGCQSTSSVNNVVSTQPQLSQLACYDGYVYIGIYAKGDFNGDGKTDVVNYWFDANTGTWTHTYHLSTGYKFVEDQGKVVAPILVPLLFNLLFE